MASELKATFGRYRNNFRTRRHDSSAHGWAVLKGYLLLKTGRTYKNMDQKVNGPAADGQDIQQFMSDPPWPWEGVFRQVHQDINDGARLLGGTLNFDESGDECSGTHKAGASRQYPGRLGKVDLGHGVLSSYSRDGVWLLTGAELYLPKKWFSDEELRSRWERLKIPKERGFSTRIDLARGLSDETLASGPAFGRTGADTFYGRDIHFRCYVADKGRRYLMGVPKDGQVWLGDPLSADNQLLVQSVQDIAASASFEEIAIRDSGRGILTYAHAFVPVWTVNRGRAVDDREAREEVLAIRREADGSMSYALGNALKASKEELAKKRAERYFVERTIQDCKGELGWGGLQALKYPAYMHTLAICSVALVFMAKVKLGQRQHYVPQEEVKDELGIEGLPGLSLANVKELMRSVMPLPKLSREEARDKVVQTLFDRTMSRASRYGVQKKIKKTF